MTIEDVIEKVKNYSEEEKQKIMKAYEMAKNYHAGQYRQSGEEYIIHPLNVAYILADMYADADTICAGLLHDTLEDTSLSKEDIAHEFNKDVANLVDGVTKISKLNFSSKQEEVMANTRKIITGITEDVRIIIIKLADRLHNMRTLEYKSVYKQKENSMETMDIFVPLAYSLGAYRIKNELEDLSLKYLYPDKYKKIKDIQSTVELDSKPCLDEMSCKVDSLLEEQNILHEIKVRTKNVYGIYKNLEQGRKIADIHDLLSLKIMVDTIPNCYLTLGLFHSLYYPVNEMFKDYISNPKTNMYSSIHSTVFGPEGRLVQGQIRTFEQDLIASFGLTAYWKLNDQDSRSNMQEELKQKYQFIKSLIEINRVFGDNQEFVNQVKREIFSDKVYVYTTKGDIIELPKGSTVVDFAYKIHTELGNTMVAAVVNDNMVDLNYELKNKDRVRIITDVYSYGPHEEWLESAKTTKARRKIKENLTSR